MTGLVMAFDFGTTKIGIAVGQKITGTATPVAIVKARDGIPRWPVIDQLMEEWQPTVLVVGLPINIDGTESDMSKAATRFSRRLHGRYGIGIELMDERLSSFEAREFETPDQLDAIAAKLILETWLADST
ncbi:Holliday junction resolvase RuvX [Gammaproteobacteria bacterium]|nr:Holliday junction resolvase RuvX [Gammaproteobacteria bacterium]